MSLNEDFEVDSDEPESLYPENDIDLTEDDIMKRDCSRGEEVDPEMKLTYQILNLVAYLICVACNALSSTLMPVSLGEIAVKYDVRVDPATWAFSIWALIYSLIGVYIIYQILPNYWIVPPKGEWGRNENLLVNQIYWILSVHLIGNGCWLFIFQADTVGTFWIAEFVIVLMLASALWILYCSCQVRLSLWEIIGLRIGFSIYCGWLTAATILGFANAGKASGLSDANYGVGFEETVAIIILWVGMLLYAGGAWWMKNPLFASVMFWAYSAIYVQQGDKGRVNIQHQLIAIMVIHAAHVLVGTTVLIYNKVRFAGTTKELKGIFY